MVHLVANRLRCLQWPVGLCNLELDFLIARVKLKSEEGSKG